MKKSREDLERTAAERNAEGVARGGPYQHWYVFEDGYGPCLTCEWRGFSRKERIRRWLIERLGGDPG